MHLDPFAPDLAARTRRVAHRLDTLGLGVTVETGARYVLDPRRKHGPSLLDPDPDDRARRVDLLLRAVRIAGDLGAHAVHCFSGTLPTGTHPGTRPETDPGTDRDMAWQRLAETLTPVLDAAATAGIPVAIEPEPGHLLATLADFHRLRRTLGDPATRRPSASPSTSATASASNRSLPPTAYAPPLPGCATSRSRTCAATSTNTFLSETARSTSRRSSPPWPRPATAG